VNPCASTTLIIPELEDLVTFIGYPVLSTQKYLFTDTISEQIGLKEYCGPIILLFSIKSTPTGLVTYNDAGYIEFAPTEGSLKGGKYSVVLKAKM